MQRPPRRNPSPQPDEDPGVREALSFVHALAAQGFRSASPEQRGGEIGGLDVTPDNLRRSQAESWPPRKKRPREKAVEGHPGAERTPGKKKPPQEAVGGQPGAIRPTRAHSAAAIHKPESVDLETIELLLEQQRLLATQSQTSAAFAGSSSALAPSAAGCADTSERVTSSSSSVVAAAPSPASSIRDPRLKLPRRRNAPSVQGRPITRIEPSTTDRSVATCDACSGSGLCAVCFGSGREPGKLFCHGCQGSCVCSACAGDRVLH